MRFVFIGKVWLLVSLKEICVSVLNVISRVKLIR